LDIVICDLEFMLIGGLQKLTLVDYPGRVAASVFTAGCNFFCPFCHNPELINIDQQKKRFFVSEPDFFDFLSGRHGMIDGICVSGGEPTVQADLPDFLKKIKALGFLVKLDTNGAKPEVLRDLLRQGLVDYLAMDIKGPLEKYQKIVKTDVDLEKIHKSTEIARSFPDYEFRTTVVPDLHEKEDFLNIARWLDGAKNYFLQQFNPKKTLDPGLKTVIPFSDEKLVEFSQMIKPYFEKCEVRI
jgi:pyruvate formate lyase activating enzyme